MPTTKLILVIGATGAQGLAVIDALLAPSENGTPSPYSIRALTRDPLSQRAQDLASKGVECIKGSLDDFKSVATAFEGVYGAWVNTDSFTVGEMKEIYAGMRIFEIAKRTAGFRHYIWSSLDNVLTKTNYNTDYAAEHYTGKSRVADWMKAHESIVSETTMSWSVVTTGPYMDMLNGILGPFHRRDDGTYVFAQPLQDGHIPMIALSDIGFWARYTFDNRAVTSAQNLEVVSQFVSGEDLVSTFERVTGQPAVYKRQTIDEWWTNFTGVDRPVASERGTTPDDSTSVRQNFTAWWKIFADDIVKRDVDWITKAHPGTMTLERWMRSTRYTGNKDEAAVLLKNQADGKSWGVNSVEATRAL